MSAKFLPLTVVLSVVGCMPTEFTGDAGSESARANRSEASAGDADGGRSDAGDGGDGDAGGGANDGGDDSPLFGTADGKSKGGKLGNADSGGEGEEDFDADEDDLSCEGKGYATTAKLLTPTVKNGQPGNYIEYELAVVDCNGKQKAVQAESIKFDINALHSDSNFNVPYTLKSGSKQVSGTMQEVVGTDLFGNIGLNYFHNKTDKAVALTSAKDVAILRVDLLGRYFDRPDGDGTPSPSLVLDTYLAFGGAAPVKKSVTFTK